MCASAFDVKSGPRRRTWGYCCQTRSMGNRKFVLFDIDGTLADNSHRQHFLMSSPKRWDEFFDEMVGDVPNNALVTLYNTLYQSKSYEMVLVTARPEKHRAVTERWLAGHSLKWNRLVMRRDGDCRRDAETKQDMLREITNSLNEIAFVVDDRTQTVQMWRSLGLTCLQCADHDY